MPSLNQDQFNFSFHPANPKEMGGRSTHTVEVWHREQAESGWAKAPPGEREHYAGSSVDPGTRPVASMSWHHQTGEVKGVFTDPAHQRQGIATALWHEGKRIATETRGVTTPKHSAQRTKSGEAWARSVGGRLPRREQ